MYAADFNISHSFWAEKNICLIRKYSKRNLASDLYTKNVTVFADFVSFCILK